MARQGGREKRDIAKLWRRSFFLATLLTYCLTFAGVNGYAQPPDSIKRAEKVLRKKEQLERQQARRANRYASTVDSSTLKRVDSIPLFRRLKRFSQRNKLLGKAYKAVIREPNFNQETQAKRNVLAPYRQFEKRPIRKIEVEVLDALGYSLTKPQKRPKNWVERTGNRLHHTTQAWVIRERLLFRTGDLVNPLRLYESERLLRDLQFLFDAKIEVAAVPGTDSVDVLVRAQDVWSLTGGAAYDLDNQSGSIRIRENNFLGTAHRLEFEERYQPDSLRKFSSLMTYLIPNFGRTYISGTVYYYNRQGDLSTGILLNRRFYSPIFRYAGGLSLYRDGLVQPYRYPDTDLRAGKLYNETTYQRYVADGWVGRAWKFKGLTLQKLLRVQERPDTGWQFIAAGRIAHFNFTEKPRFLNDNLLRDYRSRTLILGSLSLSRRSFFKDCLIYRYGRTEDVPLTRQATVTFGVEPGENYTRTYLGLLGAIAEQYNYGYVSIIAGLGTFYNQNNGPEQSTLILNAFYYTNALKLNRWTLRQFVKTRLTYGFNRFSTERIYLNQNNGIRGYRTNVIQGNRRFVVNLESNFFAPGDILGFRIATFVFADMGLIGNDFQSLIHSRLYQAYGFGVRVRNEFLAFQTIQLQVGFYPSVPFYDPPPYRFITDSRPYLVFDNPDLTRPDALPYLQDLNTYARTVDANQFR